MCIKMRPIIRRFFVTRRASEYYASWDLLIALKHWKMKYSKTANALWLLGSLKSHCTPWTHQFHASWFSCLKWTVPGLLFSCLLRTQVRSMEWSGYTCVRHISDCNLLDYNLIDAWRWIDLISVPLVLMSWDTIKKQTLLGQNFLNQVDQSLPNMLLGMQLYWV